MCPTPDKPGQWRLVKPNGETIEFDAYYLPTGHLCAWCDEVGIAGGIDQSLCWDTDQYVGHVPVSCMESWGKFIFLGEADNADCNRL
jgi:hypothetical protein